MSPDKHLRAAELLGKDVSRAHRGDAGAILSDVCRGFMDRLGIPDGLGALGYSEEDVPALVKGAMNAVRKILDKLKSGFLHRTAVALQTFLPCSVRTLSLISGGEKEKCPEVTDSG